MGLSIKIIKKDDQIISKWSGGTTTQLAIYPDDALYGERNFLWRISSAEVELPESTFTHLPGIKRIIMPITGEMCLEHEGRYKKLLKPFEQDCFSGDWITKSRGKVTDFNLMMKDCSGTIETYYIQSGCSENILIKELNYGTEHAADAFYVLGEKAEFAADNKSIDLGDRELLLVTRKNLKNDGNIFIKNVAKTPIIIIRANIFY